MCSDDGEDLLPNLSKYLLCPKDGGVCRDQEFIIDDNQFSIPIWTDAYIQFNQACIYKITKKGKSFDGIKITSNITSNLTIELFKEQRHGKLELITSDKVALSNDQSIYVLAKASQWNLGKIDMLRLEAYSESKEVLHYGLIILIVVG